MQWLYASLCTNNATYTYADISPPKEEKETGFLEKKWQVEEICFHVRQQNGLQSVFLSNFLEMNSKFDQHLRYTNEYFWFLHKRWNKLNMKI